MVDLGHAAAAGHVEQHAAARRVAGAQTGRDVVVQLALQRIAGGRGAEAAGGVHRVVLARFDQAADDEVVHAVIVADAATVLDLVTIATATVCGTRTERRTIAEAG